MELFDQHHSKNIPEYLIKRDIYTASLLLGQALQGSAELNNNEISRKRSRLDLENQEILCSSYFERPKLEKNQYIKFGINNPFVSFDSKDSMKAFSKEFQKDTEEKVKNSLSLKMPEEYCYSLYDKVLFENKINKDECPCIFLKELVDTFGKYVETPTLLCKCNSFPSKCL
jgi:hypothetical protein